MRLCGVYCYPRVTNVSHNVEQDNRSNSRVVEWLVGWTVTTCCCRLATLLTHFRYTTTTRTLYKAMQPKQHWHYYKASQSFSLLVHTHPTNQPLYHSTVTPVPHIMTHVSIRYSPYYSQATIFYGRFVIWEQQVWRTVPTPSFDDCYTLHDSESK